LGFDTESKPSFKKGNTNHVSLLQLATSSNAYLFRLNKTGLPETLIKVLSNPKILKVGIAIRDDIRHLMALHQFKPDGFLELQAFVKQFGIENSGLSKLTGIILNFRISKSQQLSNWENEVLTQAQQLYAATDAWAAYEIYETLIQL
jgi:ribonuclease D